MCNIFIGFRNFSNLNDYYIIDPNKVNDRLETLVGTALLFDILDFVIII